MLGGAKRVSVARHLQAAAARRGLTLDILSYELECSVPIASVGRVIKGLRFADAGVVDDIRHVISSEQVDLVLPFVDPAVEVVASLAGTVNAFVPVSDGALCRVMFDKGEADGWFRAHSLPVPDRVELPFGASSLRLSSSPGTVRLPRVLSCAAACRTSLKIWMRRAIWLRNISIMPRR